MENSIIDKVKEAIRQPYVWPGAYPLSVILSDGEAICPDCAKQNFRAIVGSTKSKARDGWQAVGVEILWEGGNQCAHCYTNLDAYPSEVSELTA